MGSISSGAEKIIDNLVTILAQSLLGYAVEIILAEVPTTESIDIRFFGGV